LGAYRDSNLSQRAFVAGLPADGGQVVQSVGPEGKAVVILVQPEMDNFLIGRRVGLQTGDLGSELLLTRQIADLDAEVSQLGDSAS